MDIIRPNNELIKSYNSGNIEKFKELIKDGHDVNCLDMFGKSLISLVVMNFDDVPRNKEFFDELLKAGVKLHPIGNEMGLLSCSIISKNDTYYLEKLISHKMNINSCGTSDGNNKYGPPIIDAIIFKKYNHIDVLLKNDLDISSCDEEGIPVLNFLISRYVISNDFDRFDHYFKLFVEKGFDADAGDTLGIKPLHYLSAHISDKNIFDILFNSDHPINVNSRDDKGNTPLIWAAIHNNVSSIEILIEKGVNLNLRNSEGYTALESAAIREQLESFDFLMQNGVNLLLIDKQGNNILHKIAKNNINTYCYEKISQKHPELLTMKNNKGETPNEIYNIFVKNQNNKELAYEI